MRKCTVWRIDIPKWHINEKAIISEGDKLRSWVSEDSQQRISEVKCWRLHNTNPDISEYRQTPCRCNLGLLSLDEDNEEGCWWNLGEILPNDPHGHVWINKDVLTKCLRTPPSSWNSNLPMFLSHYLPRILLSKLNFQTFDRQNANETSHKLIQLSPQKKGITQHWSDTSPPDPRTSKRINGEYTPKNCHSWEDIRSHGHTIQPAVRVSPIGSSHSGVDLIPDWLRERKAANGASAWIFKK